ncbi:MAG: MotA/TolQ/ExbB proton channel family protein [Chitinispirillaceae bacterium]|nr:MotA/TolQ/ExbB proton channel family protein [Chitinispirillaceae bacterium]
MIQSVAKWFNEGGPFMWVILGVLAMAVAVLMERLIFYYIICREKGFYIVTNISSALENNNLLEAKRIVEKGNSPMMVLLRTAIIRYSENKPFNEIEESVEETAIQQIARLPQRLNYLSLFANIATLVGLLGTISGLQLSFSSLATVEAAKKAILLANGISQAMNTTAFGLVVAVPCMIFYTFLVNKQIRLTKDIDEAVVRLMNLLRKKQKQ